MLHSNKWRITAVMMILSVGLAGQFVFSEDPPDPDPGKGGGSWADFTCVSARCLSQTAPCNYGGGPGATCFYCSTGGVKWYCVDHAGDQCTLLTNPNWHTCGSQIDGTCNGGLPNTCVGTTGPTSCERRNCT